MTIRNILFFQLERSFIIKFHLRWKSFFKTLFTPSEENVLLEDSTILKRGKCRVQLIDKSTFRYDSI